MFGSSLMTVTVLFAIANNDLAVALLPTTSHDHDQPPLSAIVYLNDYAEFTCYVRDGMPSLFWFVNSISVTGLPVRFNASSFSRVPEDGMGTISTLRLLALEETNNSLVICGVYLATSDRINISYFPAPAKLLVQGLPAAPFNLMGDVEIESSNIYIFWQQPQGLLINSGITYIININVSLINFTEQIQDVTSNLSYIYPLVEQNHTVGFCHIANVFVSVTSQNKVGIGGGITKEVSLSTAVHMCEQASESTVTTANNVTCFNNDTVEYNCINTMATASYVYVAGSAAGAVLLLLVLLAVTITSYVWWKQLNKGRVQLEPNVDLNEAYACSLHLKENVAYESRALGSVPRTHPRQTKDLTEIELEVNRAYEPVVKQPVIYEELNY